jgi:hypothetical protein
MLSLFQELVETMTAAQGAMREGILRDLLGRAHARNRYFHRPRQPAQARRLLPRTFPFIGLRKTSDGCRLNLGKPNAVRKVLGHTGNPPNLPQKAVWNRCLAFACDHSGFKLPPTISLETPRPTRCCAPL